MLTIWKKTATCNKCIWKMVLKNPCVIFFFPREVHCTIWKTKSCPNKNKPMQLKYFSHYPTLMNSQINGHEQWNQRSWTVKSTVMNSDFNGYEQCFFNGNSNGHFYKIHSINTSPSFIIFTSQNIYSYLQNG
jgi:hypothetical protein